MVPAVEAPVRVGVISDTHGLLRPEALLALAGSAHILHLGDVGDPAILEALRAVAPVTAIRGNVDREGACALLPATEVVEFRGQTLYLLHDVGDLDLNPRAAGFAAVLHGHSHQPRNERKDGVLYFNPGSAGPRRFKLPISVGWLDIDEDGVQAAVEMLGAGSSCR